MTREVTIRISYTLHEDSPLTCITMEARANYPVCVGGKPVKPGEAVYLSRLYLDDVERPSLLEEMYATLGRAVAYYEEYPDA